MKKVDLLQVKQMIPVIAIAASMCLSTVAQERSGYISSTGRSGYISSTGRTESATAASDGPTLGSGNRSGYLVSTGRMDTATPSAGDGNGTMGSGNLTNEVESTAFIIIWNWISVVI